jgi:hypothetical protein
MITLPLWATALISFVVKLISQWQANVAANQALRDLGATSQANASTAAAEKEETKARAAGAAAEDGEDDPRDLYPEKIP